MKPCSYKESRCKSISFGNGEQNRRAEFRRYKELRAKAGLSDYKKLQEALPNLPEEIKAVRDKLITGNTGLVATIVNEDFKRIPCKNPDMVSSGMLGLIRAVDQYDPDNISNTTFSTFAQRPINWAIYDSLKKTSIREKACRENHHLISAMRKLESKELARTGEKPDDARLAELLTEFRIKKAIKKAGGELSDEQTAKLTIYEETIKKLKERDIVHDSSVDVPAYSDKRTTVLDTMTDGEQLPIDSAVDDLRLKRRVNCAVRDLRDNPKSQINILLRWLDDETLEKIGTDLGFSKQYAKLCKDKAIANIAKHIRSGKIQRVSI